MIYCPLDEPLPLFEHADSIHRSMLLASPLGGLAPGEKVADLFCGAGGWGEGARELGIAVDFAINHDPVAIAAHVANNPGCKHHQGDAWRTRPRSVVGNAKLGLLLASAACTTHSRARGSAPISKRVHMLGWCIARWMEEVQHFPASTQIMLSDLHDEMICLAKIVGDEVEHARLAERLSAKVFHPAVLEEARDVLARARAGGDSWLFGDGGGGRPSPEECAEAYFTVAWMGRSGVAGTDGEDRVGLALRYDAGGGDPVKRYRSAVESLNAWHLVLRRCSITREPCWDVFDRLRQQARKADPSPAGLYCDPPWPDDGDGYLHTFTDADQRRLARELEEMPRHVRIVMRWGDHPLIRELYPVSRWEWQGAQGRTAVGAKSEVFLVRPA